VVETVGPADSEDTGPALPDAYKIVSIDSAPAPAGSEGANWHRYEICQGHNRIVGFRDGSTASVRLAVEAIVLRLNERRRHRRGRVHVVLQPRSAAEKPAKAS
jgi:hypothetical protein